jgi:hypothetical protein
MKKPFRLSERLDFIGVAPSGETANKFNEHLELILDFMGVLEHEPELMERIKSPEKIEPK